MVKHLLKDIGYYACKLSQDKVARLGDLYIENTYDQEEGEIPVLILDDVIDPATYIKDYLNSSEGKNYVYVERGVPLYRVYTTDNDLDEYLNGVKVRGSYIKGKKYQDVEVKVTFTDNIYCQKKIIELIDNPIYDKRVSFPVVDYFDLVYKGGQCDTGVIIDVYDTVLDLPVCTIVGAKSKINNKIYGNFIVNNQDPRVNKKHAGIILGHVEMVRLAYRLGIEVVDFSIHMPYKELLNGRVEYHAGIRFKC